MQRWDYKCRVISTVIAELLWHCASYKTRNKSIFLCEFSTDHVILLRMTAETLGFPSRNTDDPVLQPAMPGGDSFEDAEERRQFCVALTRAKATVTLITLAHNESPFIAELVMSSRFAGLAKDAGIFVHTGRLLLHS